MSRKIILYWSVLLAVKLILSVLLPISADETYYWVWSYHLDWSYFDHPAMIAWWFKLSHFLPKELFRWPGVILGHFAYLIWIDVFRKKAEATESQCINLQWLFFFHSLLGFGSLILTPDAPLLLFSGLAVWSFIQIEKNQKTLHYAFFGVFLGLGFTSKYHMALYPIFFLLYVGLNKKWNLIFSKKIAVTFISGLLFSFPVLYWNYKNDFASFKFQLDHGLGETYWEFYWTWSYFLVQGLFIGLWFLPELTRLLKNHYKNLFLILSLGPIFFFGMTSFKGVVEPNWPIQAYYPLFCLLIMNGVSSWKFKAHMLLGILVYMIFVIHSIRPILPMHAIRFNEQNYFRPIVTELHDNPVDKPVYASTYQMASMLSFDGGKPYSKLKGMSRFDMYDLFKDNQTLSEEFYLVKEGYTGLTDPYDSRQYEITKVKDINTNFELLHLKRR